MGNIRIYGGGTNYNPSTSDVVLDDRQPFYSKFNKKFYIGDGESALKDLAGTQIGLNIENGIGTASVVVKTGDNPDVDYINYAQHEAGIALGDLNRADGRKSIALGTQNNVTSYIPYKLKSETTYEELIAATKDIQYAYLSEDKSKYIHFATNDGSSLRVEVLEDEYFDLDDNLQIYKYIRVQANSSIAIGQVNTVYGNCGGAFGYTNTLGINGGHSFVFGRNNYLDSYRSFVAGENNKGENGKYHQFILGNDNIALGDKEILLGTGLKSSAIYQTAVGKFNEDKPNALFVVGAGGSDGTRRNILEVEHYLANLNGTLNINDHFNVSGNSTLKGSLSVRAGSDKNIESFYINEYGAYDIGGKLSNASNLNNGDATGSLVVTHVSNAKANKATGIGSLVGGSANFWQAENNIVSGANSIAWGYKTTVTADHSYGLGWGISIKNSTRKLAYGIYNEDKANTVFEIGKGSNDTNRKNIFEITDSGIARAYGTPVGDNDVLRWQEKVALEDQLSEAIESINFPVTSVAGKTGVVTLSKSDVGLSNVDNKSVSTIKSELTGSIEETSDGFVKGSDVFNMKTNLESSIDTAIEGISVSPTALSADKTFSSFKQVDGKVTFETVAIKITADQITDIDDGDMHTVIVTAAVGGDETNIEACGTYSDTLYMTPTHFPGSFIYRESVTKIHSGFCDIYKNGSSYELRSLTYFDGTTVKTLADITSTNSSTKTIVYKK